MTHPDFDTVLRALRHLHARNRALREFCPLPTALVEQPVTAHHIAAAGLMETDQALVTTPEFAPLRDAFIAASPVAQWRETYKGTRLDTDFMDRFACYCLIGAGGPFASSDIGAYVVYMPAGLYYPFHHHPAEELYFLLAGQADFLMKGQPTRTLGPGEYVFHPSNEPHATQTRAHPFMALVLWRGDLQTAPVLTHPEGTA